MVPRKDPISTIITRLAAAIALVVSISLPLGYALTSLKDVGDSLEFKAKVKASALNGLIANSPDVWMFAENRIQGLVSREPVPLDNELVQIFDAQDNVVVQSGKEPTAPVVSRSYPLFDADRPVGRVAVSSSQVGLIYKILAAALLGLVLGTLVFVIMRVLPLRALRRSAEALFEEKDRAEATLRSISDAVITTDAQGRLKQANPAGLAVIEADKLEQVAGHSMLDVVAPDYRAAYAEHHRRVLAGESMKMEYEIIGLKGDHRWLETHAVPLQDHGERVHLAVVRDITERKKTDAELEHYRSHLEDLVEQRTADLRVAAAAFDSQDAMMVTDANSVILQVNRAFTEITGYTAEEAVGKTPSLLESGRHDADFYRAMWETIRRTGGWQGEVWDRRKNGEVYPKWISISALKDPDGAVTHYISAHHDITERKAAEEEIRNLAFYDHLTGLPNRRLLIDRVRQAMASTTRSNRYCALMFIDLDNFKTLNDTLGHDFGDLLLKEVAKRLRSRVRVGDTVARLGGDEFVVMLEDLSANPEEAASQTETAGEKILATLNQPYQLATQKYQSTPSIGVTLFADHQGTIDDLLKRADLAMYQAKAAGRNTLRFFDPEMQAVVSARAALEASFREAIQKNQFLLHYQAQVVGEGRLTGVEALVRWQHPERGMVSPVEFIPLAEDTSLILPLGHWVLQTACAQLALWAARPEMAHLTIAVNLSSRQLKLPNFVDEVQAILDHHGANPQRLKLELTESVLVHDVEDIIVKMTALKAVGVGFSLDDFGTGYSSLSYLKRLPLDQLKIDQGFVRDILTDPNDAAIAKMVIVLAESLGLAVIAEGVETLEQRDFLASQGCHAYQGYLFSRPLPLNELEKFVTRPMLANIHPVNAMAYDPAIGHA